MILPSFEYLAPRTVADAVAALASRGPDAKVLAGGQSLIPLLGLRVVRPSIVVDIGRIDSLRYVRRDAGVLRIGALARHRDLERSPDARAAAPILADAARFIGHAHIRNRGTIGGSLAHADPAAEWPAALLALDARVVVRGSAGEREVAVGALITGPLTTSLAQDELITEIRVPVPAPGHGWAFHEFAIRSGDFALASAAVVMPPAGSTDHAIRIVVGGSGPVPSRCLGAESVLDRQRGDDASPHTAMPSTLSAAAAEAAAEAAREIEASDDGLASEWYRRRIVEVLVRDALLDAVGRTREPAPEAGV